ncbi:MAG TPA: hypothetical protein VMR25_03235 [Planctomycetaceae bacterium]|jgi:hypothetical protein|nr:hypothetical protein [Planctomycetaceae bacterium]
MPAEHLLQLGGSDPTSLIVIVSLVGGLAIVCAIVAGAVAITRIATRHRERMARIGMGLDPDSQEPLSGLPVDRSSSPNASTGNASTGNASTGAWDRFAAPRS